MGHITPVVIMSTIVFFILWSYWRMIMKGLIIFGSVLVLAGITDMVWRLSSMMAT
jgi:hypothetical protein